MPELPDQTVKPLRLLALAMGPLLLTLLMSTGPAGAQSFDCQKAYYSDEKTICQDSGLGKLDQELASVYGRWVAKLPKNRRDEIDANETLFVQARRRCGHNRDCIEQSYRNRIGEIQGARADEDRGRPDRATASDLRGRPGGAAAATPEREPLAGEKATGAATTPPQPAEREVEPPPRNDASRGPSSDAASATSVPPVSPTRAEAAEALRSAERDGSTETETPKRRHKSRAQPLSSSSPDREAPSSGSKTEHVKREPPSGETNAAAAPPPVRHPGPKRTSTTTASAAPPKEQAPAPSQSALPAGSGSSGWVNPPPER